MTFANLPKMFLSESEGWSELARLHPSVTRLLFSLVAPLSLIPPLMHAYAQRVHPGVVAPLVEPPLTGPELVTVGALFFAIELAAVGLMGVYIQRLGETVEVRASYEEAYTLAAVAPTPLWLAALALFVPSVWFNVLVLAAAWVGSVALIRHGVRPLFGLTDETKAHRLANAITLAGVGVWLGLLAVFMMLLGMTIGWR